MPFREDGRPLDLAPDVRAGSAEAVEWQPHVVTCLHSVCVSPKVAGQSTMLNTEGLGEDESGQGCGLRGNRHAPMLAELRGKELGRERDDRVRR